MTITLWWHWVLLVVGGHILFCYVMPKVDGELRGLFILFLSLFMTKEGKKKLATKMMAKRINKSLGLF